MFEHGLCFSLPIILIPALTGIYNKHNQKEILTITNVQASWLGALMYLALPVGSLFSIPITDPLGRKLSMILVNIPFAFGWYLLYQADTVWEVFTGIIFFGFAVGLMEAPILTYIGEICEPSFRGILIGYTCNCFCVGVLVLSLLNTMMPWRTVCCVCLALPFITAIALFFVPETPQWLLSKNRTADAEKSLRWLRGWVTNDAVAQEFNDFKRQSERSKSCAACIKQNLECSHPLPTLTDKIAEFKRKRTLKPFFIVISLFILTQFCGILAMKPFMVQIFKAYGSPVAPDKAAAIMSILDIIGNVMFTFLVRFTGKRRLCLFCLSSMVVFTGIITWFGFTYLPPGYTSFDHANRKPFHLENKALSYIPMVCLLMWSFLTFSSLISSGHMSLSELFPFKSRGIAAGLATAINFIVGFISKKVYYDLEAMLSLPGISLMYTLICFFGLVLMYNIYPETENRSLEDIELHFADNSKGITDRNVVISKHRTKTEYFENGNNGRIKFDLERKCSD